MSTSNASHHAKKLMRLGLIELVEERDVGGSVQHFYRAVVRPIIDTKTWDRLDIAERQRYSIWIVRMILADAAIAFSAGTFDAKTNNHLSRTPLLLDEQGLAELSRAQTRLLTESVQIETNAIARMAEGGEEGMHVISVMMCFPLPEASQGLAGSPRDG
jgi:DNA-binding transcriptional ArsR family regulator